MISAKLWLRAKRLRYWLEAQAAFTALALVRRLPPDRALRFVDKAARRVGPLMGRHRVALHNLREAFPEKSEEEIRKIALDMWGNMARLAAEYVFLDQIFDFDPNAEEQGRIEVSGKETFFRLVDAEKPCIFFTGHLGNFELLPICAAAFGLNVTALFRPPNNPFIAQQVLSERHTKMGHLVPSKAGAAWALASALDKKDNVGMLVDQFFFRGPSTTFFGRPCRTNPLLPKLARQFDCDVYPARCIRLPGDRYRLELSEKIELPRGKDGEIDIVASTQMLNDVVEGWIREYPGQWTWFHKRWKAA